MSHRPKILVTGADGQVGNALLKRLKGIGDLVATDLMPLKIDANFYQMDFCSKNSILNVLEQVRPSIIVNPAAYTAVDKAETDQEKALLINAEAPKVLAGYCEQHRIPLIHFSTDYVFPGDGQKARSEEDPTGPLNFYGLSKLKGEQAILESGCDGLIFRTSWVFSAHGQNFVKTMLRLGEQREELKIVGDQIGAPTSAGFLAEMISRVIDLGLKEGFSKFRGLYHLCNEGETNWCEFANTIFEFGKKQGISLKIKNVFAIKTEEYPTPAVRPKNSRLNCSKFKTTYKISKLQSWKEALETVVQDLGISH